VFHLAVPLGFGAIALLLMPMATVFQFDFDEGMSLVNALLYNQGYPLAAIWSDQPPLLTVTLAAWLRVWGDSIVAARSLILGFSMVLVWAFAQVLRRAMGDRFALLGTGLLILTANFLRLSVSVMIGMPSLACLMVSLYGIIRYHESRCWYWVVCSGIVAGLSLQYKMFTILLLPLWGLYLWGGGAELSGQAWRDRYRWGWLLLWGGCLGLTFLGLEELWGMSLDDTFLFHIQGDLKRAFVQEHSLWDVFLFYAQELDNVGLACFGIMAQVGRSRRQPAQLNTLPLLWLLWVTVFLINHKPIWYHHALLIALPLVWLATLGLKICWTTLHQRAQGWRQVSWPWVAIAFVLFAIPVKLTVLHLNNHNLLQRGEAYRGAIAQLQAEQPAPDAWFFTDIPIYSFYTHRNIPPEIATLSRKRIAAQDFTAAQLRDLIETYDLQQFLIGRFPIVEDFLRQLYPDRLETTDYPTVRYYHLQRDP
jgi:4-amino-4-deoxy-L-arabinose transferase-like glycosyltransferase